MKMRRYGSTISIDVDIDVDEVLSEVTNEQLLAECKDRDLLMKIDRRELSARDWETREEWLDLSDQIRRAAQGDHQHLDILLIRMIAMAGVPRLTVPTDPSPKQSTVHH